MAKHTIFIAGGGGIGRAAGLMLRHLADFNAVIYVGDVSPAAVAEAVAYIESDTPVGEVKGVLMPKDGSSPELDAALSASEVLLDCLPGSQAPRMARMALAHGLHYANLTEYVQETNEIKRIAADSDKGFVLQTGLAPGFVGILAMDLLEQFAELYGGSGEMEYVSMKVGALTKSASPPHFYGFTWSTIGVATEYVKDAIVIRDFGTTSLPSLSEYEQLVINGVRYEADLTSGGAADLPEALAGRVRKLDYKTLRWPGHYDWVKSQLAQLPTGADAALGLEKQMLATVPVMEDDLVVIQAYVVGRDKFGQLRQHGRDYAIESTEIGGQRLRAIQATTAAPLVECARMLLTGKLHGIVLQSQIKPSEFLIGPFVRAVYGG